MDYGAILHYTIYGVVLVGVPLMAGAAYYMLVLHQAVRNEERYAELRRYEGKRRERLKRMAEAKRLADPFFHFNINQSKSIDTMVEEQLAAERGTGKLSKRDIKIVRAIEEGRLILLDTPLEDCTAGMVVGRPVHDAGLVRGMELNDEVIARLRASGHAALPVLYNPNRLAEAISGVPARAA
jgi:hypothetical protein